MKIIKNDGSLFSRSGISQRSLSNSKSLNISISSESEEILSERETNYTMDCLT